MRPCEGCGGTFDYCGSCQPGRRYCDEVCSGNARRECVRLAHRRYNDRDSEEGRKAHRLEEADRRARRGGEPVGDHRCNEKSEELRARPSTALHAIAETLNASDDDSASPPCFEALELSGMADERPWASTESNSLEWLLVAWPGLLVAASRRQGVGAICPFCGRQGRIVEIISVEQWRHSRRRGLET